MTPKQIIKRQAQLTTAHRDYERGLHLHAFFKMRNHATGDDLVQETFLKTWHYLVKGGKIEIMKAFLYHVLNNLIVDDYRKRKSISLDALLEKGVEPSVVPAVPFFNLMDGKAASLLIQQLPLKYQKVIHMRYLQELSLQEISLITGQSKNAIAVQIHRGLEKLKLLYGSTQG
jgi:RNA polymerase sigma-70 factor (ECF subfamily)